MTIGAVPLSRNGPDDAYVRISASCFYRSRLGQDRPTVIHSVPYESRTMMILLGSESSDSSCNVIYRHT